jgi:phage major head subunit gpT-like protein
MAITPQFLFDLESNMRVIQEDTYAKLSSNLWWSRFMRVQPSKSKREIVHWLISSAMIEDMGPRGGNMTFEELVSTYTEFQNRYSGKGLKVIKSEFDDLDGSGIEQATTWSRDMGRYMAYWPQKQLVKLILNGETGKTYDGKAFFATDHLNHPLDASKGSFANLFTGAASGTYPGALKIDASISAEQAAINLGKAIAYVRGVPKLPNGEDPRYIKPSCLIVPPALSDRAQLLTTAKYIAIAAAAGGAGTADVEGMIRSWQLSEPIVAEELGASFAGGSDTDWYMATDELDGTQLGSFVYIDRDPYKITYYGNVDHAFLDRAQELEWHNQGRNGTGYGHPYGFNKFKAA